MTSRWRVNDTPYPNEPVMPISTYCGILWDYLDILEDRLESEKERGTFRDDNLRVVAEAAGAIRMVISKSSYLDRRMYGQEVHRTRKCPEHQGIWSGLSWDEEPCGCDLTGWLHAGFCTACNRHNRNSPKFCGHCGEEISGRKEEKEAS